MFPLKLSNKGQLKRYVICKHEQLTKRKLLSELKTWFWTKGKAISTILKYWENQIVSWTLICFNQRWCIFCNKISCHFGRNLKFAFIPFSQICIKDSVRWNLLVSPDLMMADCTQDCIALLQNLQFGCFCYIHVFNFGQSVIQFLKL